MQCLIVDDEKNFADFIKDALDEFGFQTLIATSANEFCQLYSCELELIIIDLCMPDMDGLQVLRFLHENGSNAGIIFVSGQHEGLLNSAVELGNEWGADILGALPKPFTAGALEALVGTFDKRQTQSELQPVRGLSLHEVETALQNKEFRLVYQPLVCAKTLRILGAEALIRLDNAKYGHLGPDVFIPIAEENGQIGAINTFVAETAISQLALWNAQGLDMFVSINMSPASIADVNMPESLTELARAHGVSPEKVTIELTETAVMDDVADYIDLFTRLRLRGFELAIDDFGIGHSSLRRLVRLPFTKMKIDRSFVGAASENKERFTVAKMAAMLAHELGMEVIAEGVEDEKTLRLMNEINCDLVQGYLIARPMTASDFKDWSTQQVMRVALTSA